MANTGVLGVRNTGLQPWEVVARGDWSLYLSLVNNCRARNASPWEGIRVAIQTSAGSLLFKGKLSLLGGEIPAGGVSGGSGARSILLGLDLG